MDIKQAFPIVIDRIKRIRPSEHATKIVGYLLLAYSEEDVISLAHCSDERIEKVVLLVKKKLSQVAVTQPTTTSPSLTSVPFIDNPPQYNPLMPRVFSSPAIERPKPLLYDQLLNGSAYSPSHHDTLAELQDQTRSMSLVDRYDLIRGSYPEEASGHICRKISKRPLNLSPMPCHFEGFCRDGNSCTCFHKQERPSPEHFSPLFNPSANQYVNDEQMFLHGSLKKLEMEIADLLKINEGKPIQIEYLPILYFETYGKHLLADGYRTGSHRNGKPEYGLVKLLSSMKNSLCIIDRPNGQRSIILVEDAPKYNKHQSFRSSPGPIVSGSRQIYLTFPKESTFTDVDVAEYFSKFGEVNDVRIPCQNERMFGFVSFSSPETVKTILSLRKEHFIRGYQVLVKRYREKPKPTDRGAVDYPVYSPHSYFDMDTEFEFTPRALEAWPSLREQQQQHMEPDLQGVDVQRLMEFQLPRNAELLPASPPDCLPDSINDAEITP